MVEILEEDLPSVIHFTKVILNRLDEKGLEEVFHEYWEPLGAKREEEGKKEGKKEEKQAIARQMKAKGFDNNMIAELTGLSLDEIAKL